MILSAIYLEDHFLFERPQIINLGGKNIYSLTGNLISKSRNKNEIPKFYSESTITLVSAIVGRNGSGKSSLLSVLIDLLNKEYGYISALIFEENDKIIIRQRSNVKFDFDYIDFGVESSTYYYSPYLDFRTEKNGFDISLDSIVSNDLENIEDIRKASERVDPLNHLRTRNWLRQMDFTNSEIGKEFTSIFDLPSNNLNRITFTRYIIEVDKSRDEIQFHNTPYDFRKIIQFIYDKIRAEAKSINQNRPLGYNLVDLQKELLKNYFLMDFICLFIIQMEKENRYLQEGFLKSDSATFIKMHQSTSAMESFLDFLKEHFFRLGKGEFQLLPVEETEKLILAVYKFIDDAEAIDDRDTRNFDWDKKAIYLQQYQAIELLELQNRFLNIVENYYRTSFELNTIDLRFSKFSRITDFINFEPSERNLSSGENALLNLFARFHEILGKELHKLTKSAISSLNFVLLDEADLGFHPKWKKQFVSSIIYFFETYFNKLGTKAQIIFTTHDPLTLSDILNYNVIYLDKSNSEIVISNDLRPTKSFGANITDLLADSFFIGDGLIGDLARTRIQEVIEYINDSDRTSPYWITKPEDIRKFIHLIGEPFLEDKLIDMFLERFPEFNNTEYILLRDRLQKMRKDDTN